MRSFPSMTKELNVKASGKNWNCLAVTAASTTVQDVLVVYLVSRISDCGCGVRFYSLKPVCVFASFPLTRAHVSLIVIRSYCWCQSGILRNYGDGVSPHRFGRSERMKNPAIPTDIF